MQLTDRPLNALFSLLARNASTCLIAGFVLIAAITGAVVSTGNVIMIALAVGAVAGVALIGLPAVGVTLVIGATLVLSGPLVYYVQALDKLPWLFSTMGLLLAISALLHAGLARGVPRAPLPGFMIAALMFIAFALASMMWAEGPAGDGARGLKRLLQYWGLLLALGMIAFSPRTIWRWAQLIAGIALMQAPMAVYQRLVLIPSLPGEPIDAVVGTLELSQMGTGAAGVLGMMQVMLIAALLCAYREKLVPAWALPPALLVAFVPIAVGEVNAVFILLPIALLVVFADQLRRNLFRFMAYSAATTLAIGVLGAGYLVSQQTGSNSPTPIDERIATLIEYNVGSIGYATKDGLNRRTVWQEWVKHHGLNDPKATLLGHGAGASFSAEDGRSEVNRQYGGQLLDLVALTAILWDFGLIGFGLFLTVFVGAAWRALALVRVARPGIDRALARACLTGSVIILISLIYNNAMIMMPSQQVLSFMVLGFIAWLDQRYRTRAPLPAARGANTAS